MKIYIRHILVLLFLLVRSFSLSGQENAALDAELDRYDMLCGMCMDLRTRISEGEPVSRNEAQAFINRFLALNRDLKAREQEMNPYQRRRFASIGQWFSTGVKPKEHLPLVKVLPFVANEKITSLPKNDAPVFPDIEEVLPVVDDIVDARQDLDLILLAELSTPSMSYGIRAGLMVSRFGGYTSFRSDFRPDEYSYTCMSDGSLQGGGVFWSGGESRSSSMAVHGGLLVRTTPWLTAYVGAGYGRTSQMWQDIGGKWAQVSDISFQGLSAEAGAILTWKMLAFSAGLSTVSFKTVSFTFGLGVRF